MDIGVIIGLISLTIGIAGLAWKLHDWWQKRKEEKQKFNRMGTFFTSDELRKEPLERETIEKIAHALLKCDPREWNPGFHRTYRVDRIKKRILDQEEEVYQGLRGFVAVLIYGEAGVGKSRTALEVLRGIFMEREGLKALVIVLTKQQVAEVNRLPVPKHVLKGYDLVVLFLDDLEIYIGTVRIRSLLDKFRKVVRSVWLIATIRSELLSQVEKDPEFTHLFGAGEEARKRLWAHVELYKPDEGREIARLANRPFRLKEFDGTGASIIYGVHRKRELYDKLVREKKVAELDVLHAIKLLRLSGISFPRLRHVRMAWAKIFGHPESEWATCYGEIKEMGFFLPFPPDKPERIIMLDVLLEKVITGYPAPGVDLVEHMMKLAGLLREDGAWEELFYLGVALGIRGHHAEALNCFDAVIQLKPDLAEAYYNRGNAWAELGEFNKAIQDYDRAWSLREKLPDRGARIPLAAIATILLSIRASRPIPGLGQAVSIWRERAEEVMDLMAEEKKELLKKLLREVGGALEKEAKQGQNPAGPGNT